MQRRIVSQPENFLLDEPDAPGCSASWWTTSPYTFRGKMGGMLVRLGAGGRDQRDRRGHLRPRVPARSEVIGGNAGSVGGPGSVAGLGRSRFRHAAAGLIADDFTATAHTDGSVITKQRYLACAPGAAYGALPDLASTTSSR